MINIFKINRQNRILRFALVFGKTILAVALFFAVLIFSNKVIYQQDQKAFEHELGQIRASIEGETQNALEQSRDLVNRGELTQYIVDKDILNVVAILNEERMRRDIGMLMAVDNDGVALSRTQALSKRGDYVFQTTSWGKTVADGNEVASIEVAPASPLVLIGGAPIKRDGEILGAIFAGQLISDEYASYFKKKYLGEGSEIAFYSKKEGIVGSSFTDKEVKDLLVANFNPGSDWVQKHINTKINTEVTLDGDNYLIDNIVFNGIQDSVGGAIVFYPRYYYYQNLIPPAVALTSFLLLVIVYLLFHKKIKAKQYLRLSIVGVSLFALALFLNTLVINQWLYYKIAIKKPVYIIYNSIMEFEPNYGIFNELYDTRIAIMVMPGGEAINVVRAIVNYDPKMIRVDDIITTNSFCRQGMFDMFIEKTIDNELGQVIVSCGLPNPGFSGKSGIVAELRIRPLQVGQFNMRFGEESVVLANDGLGTDVLRTSVGSSYFILNHDDYRSGLEKFSAISVFSLSHPNSEHWYNRRKVELAWHSDNNNEQNNEYSYLFDQDELSIPNGELRTTENSISIDAESNGVYYFHIAAIKNDVIGPVFHYKIMIDDIPPLQPIVKISSDIIAVGEITRVEFSGQDKESGLQSEYYYVKIDNSDFLPVQSPLYVPFDTPGKHEITIRVFDKADNINDTSVIITVKGGSIFSKIINIDIQSAFMRYIQSAP